MHFPFKKPRGSNLNNGEVQYLLQNQEGQIKKSAVQHENNRKFCYYIVCVSCEKKRKN